MLTGWNYRVTSLLGVVGLTMMAVLVANLSTSQHLFTTYVPVFWNLSPNRLSGSDLWLALWLPAFAVAGCLVPLYKPRPRRVLDIVALAQKRVVIASCVLATLGYFNYSYRLPRGTLVMMVAILFVVIPVWFVLIRHRPVTDPDRTIIVGDDHDAISNVLEITDLPILGYVSPTVANVGERSDQTAVKATDGGTQHAGVPFLDDLSHLESVLVEHDVDTAVLAFTRADRVAFFGALGACYAAGVTAHVHRKHAERLLTTNFDTEDLIGVDLEPWDTLDHMIKRGFDLVFSSMALLFAAPLMGCISLAIKLDDGGPILYSQERTATFGDTFRVYKFRSMVVNAESVSGAKISEEDCGDFDPRVTRIGRVLRKTHLDEIPQLWSILVGDMSVVGPRPERPALESEIEDDVVQWRRRWFVKPGLTGLAQINDVTGHEPEKKLRNDVEYIQRQSFWFDLKIIVRQMWKVVVEVDEAL